MRKLTQKIVSGVAILLLMFAVACSDDDPVQEVGGIPEIPEIPLPGEDDEYVIPTYPDDYTSIAAWSLRSQWNLANVHDPTIEKSGDYYYMYGTDASYGNAHDEGGGHFAYRRSRNLVDWTFCGFAMDAPPAWVKDSLNNMRVREGLPEIPEADIRYAYWAPVVRKVGNKYRMYYSIVIENYIKSGRPTSEPADGSWTERAFIGLMESEYDLQWNTWEDKGMVVCSISDKPGEWQRPTSAYWDGYFYYNAIDPTYIVTPEDDHWLIYGSWHSGLGAIQLNPETGKPYKFETYEDVKRIVTRNTYSRWQASEAPEVVYNEETGYYYLFVAYDEVPFSYNTRVARSRNVDGPYYGSDGADINGAECYPIITMPYKFGDHHGWFGFSHCCIFRDDDGNWFYSSQARLPANLNGNAYSNANMMGFVNQIRWTSDGWPVVMPERYAAVPTDEPITEAELVGEWDFIKFNYVSTRPQIDENQSRSVALTLKADGTAVGGLTGSWKYDAAKKQLMIGNQELLVERGLDWEANPRSFTLIFAGIEASQKKVSLWGKKK